MLYVYLVYPSIAQLVEQLPLKETVQGSNPCGWTNDFIENLQNIHPLFLW